MYKYLEVGFFFNRWNQIKMRLLGWALIQYEMRKGEETQGGQLVNMEVETGVMLHQLGSWGATR